MAYDAELDRLKEAQRQAFRRKQNAYQAMQAAWRQRQAARDALDKAYQAMTHARGVMNAAWEDLQLIRNHNGPRIDALNDQQERAFQQMRYAFDQASQAHDNRDGASARSWADDGHRHKQEAQDAVADRRLLVQEIRDARDRLENTKPAFQQAKKWFDDAKRHHDWAKGEHERLQAEFKAAKADFDQAVRDFKARLEAVRAERERRRTERERQAQEIEQQLARWAKRFGDGRSDSIKVKYKPDLGYTDIYFGGIGRPDGRGHGHIQVLEDGTERVVREPSLGDRKSRKKATLLDSVTPDKRRPKR